MHRVSLAEGADLAGFRAILRRLIPAGVAPEAVVWSRGGSDLFGADPLPEAGAISLPREVVRLIECVVCHRDPERFALLYQLVWRIQRGARDLLTIASDPLVHRLEWMRKSVRRDIHKMHAFLRFRRIDGPDGTERFAAWFEPEHFILEAAAPFFVNRFRALDWSIVTPVGSAHWLGGQLCFGPAGKRDDVPASDAFEAGWRIYYESTFNPARANPDMMRKEMPVRYWRNMPEAAAIPDLLRGAQKRTAEMIEREGAMPRKREPEKAVAAMAAQEPKSLAALNRIISASPPLVPGATQAVLGEGPAHAEIVLVGEQPGDQEDIKGRPFVGPAGQLLDRAMEEAGLARDEVYLTNAVKHFKFEQRGKTRIHQKPTAGEIKHYRWWLMKELDLVRPRVVVALGATAAQALSGKPVAVMRARGQVQFDGRAGFITVHPSYLLRIPDEDEKAAAYRAFVADLRKVKQLAAAQDGATVSGLS